MGRLVYNRFRELEQAPDERRLDVVLMAAVTSFEELSHPGRRDLRQFAELFAPLFSQASRAARRTAVAALSRCRSMPAEIVELIAGEEMDVAAPFLANSPALDDARIARLIATSGPAHARALARRRTLSPRIVALLAGTGDAAVLRALKVRRLLPAHPDEDASAAEPENPAGSEELRRQLRALVRADAKAPPPARTAPFPKSLSPAVADRLRRFAEEQEPYYFATALADALGSSFRLAERIMLDINGGRLAETLTALGLGEEVARTALEAFFPHLRRAMSSGPLSQLLLRQCDPEQAAARLGLWLREDQRAAASSGHLQQITEGRPKTRGPTRPLRPAATSLQAASSRSSRRPSADGVIKGQADGN